MTRLFRQAFQSKKLKSGKDYKRHSALSNVNEVGKVAYLPAYMVMFV